MKLIAYLTMALVAFASWQWRKYDARKRLSEMDSGKRCVNCEKTECVVQDGRVLCSLCGHSEILANIAAVQLSDSEINDMTHRQSKGV